MPRAKNPCGKTRKVEEPYEIWKSADGTWEWRVLRKYQTPERETANPFARWLCAVMSPFTQGTYDYGDVYVREIKKNAFLVVPVPVPSIKTADELQVVGQGYEANLARTLERKYQTPERERD